MAGVTLHRTGITMYLEDPIDIAHYKNLGYQEVKSGKKSGPAKEDSEADEAPGAKLSPVVKLALESLGLEDPEDLSSASDKVLLDIKGIGRAALRGIRNDYPLESDKDGE